MNSTSKSRDKDTEPPHKLFAWASLVAILLVLFSGVFGSKDVEESVNSAYSAGISTKLEGDSVKKSGVKSIVGVPVYDTMQGTGDRLPYQASWAQSVTWPIRFFVGWKYYSLVRTFLFAIPSIFLGMLTINSWIRRISPWSLIAFGFLSNSSIGVYMRWNDWSDHYVQTLGVSAVCYVLLHRHFHDTTYNVRLDNSRPILFCLTICLNGVLTGHPGFWPIALVVPGSFLLALSVGRTFRERLSGWISSEMRLIAIGLLTVLVTLFAIISDLLGELQGQSWGEQRLSRTQGFFSEYAFQGVYGLRPDGLLPEQLRRAISTLLATTMMPLFVTLDPWLPRFARATDYAELTRLEFSGGLILCVLLLGAAKCLDRPVMSMVGRAALAQAIVWIFIVAANRDLLSTVLAPSGAWLVLPVLLTVNTLISIVVLLTASLTARRLKFVALGNLALVCAWCMFQFGALAMGTGLKVPDRIPTWSADREQVSKLLPKNHEIDQSRRVIIAASLERRPLINLLSVGVPVVSPADPKIRSQAHLVDGFAFNYSIDPISISTMSMSYADTLLDFVQATDLIVDVPLEDTTNSTLPSGYLSGYLQSTPLNFPNRWEDSEIQEKRVRILHRDTFSSFLLLRDSVNQFQDCPILKQQCSLISSARRVSYSARPKLQRCVDDCVWKYENPTIEESDVLILPVTYDPALRVRQHSGTAIKLFNVGGFLAVGSEAGLPSGTLTFELNPDLTMLARVSTSYLNIITVVVFAMYAISGTSSWSRIRRKALRIKD